MFLILSAKIKKFLFPSKKSTILFLTAKSCKLIKHVFACSVPGCGRTFNGESGEIKSPNHPDRHPESLDCSYLICVARDKLVTLRFTHFDLEAPESESIRRVFYWPYLALGEIVSCPDVLWARHGGRLRDEPKEAMGGKEGGKKWLRWFQTF